MAEEFQESDVFWPEQSQSHRREDRLYHSVFQDENVNPAKMIITNNNNNNSAATQQKKKNNNNKQKNTSHSLPVTIPCNMNQRSNNFNSSFHYSDSIESDEELEEAEMVPPHLMVAGRCTGQMAYSVCTGNGRTLKGRDLSRVRNSILRMTGFLET
ncbi:homeobox protein 6-like [Macadamia integrifolia]|uniref:homeobox protein 6-like n=1 Tax=Macadamia integrifolia TaxID=60698 RepID=UPI001C4EDB2F|nr:homeobox protein 6-like [Macadamia integrifolia]